MLPEIVLGLLLAEYPWPLSQQALSVLTYVNARQRGCSSHEMRHFTASSTP